MPGSPVLLLSADPASAELVSTVLTGIGYTVDVVTDPDEAVARAHGHVLVMLDVVSGAKGATQVCREIRETDSGTAIPILAVAQNDEVEERIRFLESGADDVMARPFDGRELEARVEALLLRFRRARELGKDASAIRRTVAPQGPTGPRRTGSGLIARARARATRLKRVQREGPRTGRPSDRPYS